ncbi:Hypothetical predicted protein [Podarcis lilfordi]|uniref:Uncharacterized protein n=1 Tax=Podarcis lilfordi TaxID=74358 RepID=A0AA35KYW0_9SAUR|nr:Hypothetical predicted protein [Podarcis lilfordi]
MNSVSRLAQVRVVVCPGSERRLLKFIGAQSSERASLRNTTRRKRFLAQP